MDSPPSSMRELARRLLAAEAAAPCAVKPSSHEAVRVCDKLRISLTRFAGPDGFTSLMRRAMSLARVEVLALHNLQVGADGSLVGLKDSAANDPIGANSRDGVDMGAEAAIALTAHLLGLLVTFVGEPITLRLVRSAWPDATLDEPHARNEDL